MGDRCGAGLSILGGNGGGKQEGADKRGDGKRGEEGKKDLLSCEEIRRLTQEGRTGKKIEDEGQWIITQKINMSIQCSGWHI